MDVGGTCRDGSASAAYGVRILRFRTSITFAAITICILPLRALGLRGAPSLGSGQALRGAPDLPLGLRFCQGEMGQAQGRPLHLVSQPNGERPVRGFPLLRRACFCEDDAAFAVIPAEAGIQTDASGSPPPAFAKGMLLRGRRAGASLQARLSALHHGVAVATTSAPSPEAKNPVVKPGMWLTKGMWAYGVPAVISYLGVTPETA